MILLDWCTCGLAPRRIKAWHVTTGFRIAEFIVCTATQTLVSLNPISLAHSFDGLRRLYFRAPYGPGL